MRARLPLLLLPVSLMTVVAGCGSARNGSPAATHIAATPSTSISHAPPAVAVRWSVIGGCEISPTGCPSYVVWGDGTVDARRSDGTAPTIGTGHVAAADVTALTAIARTTDPTALRAEVGPGVCNSCVDGADLVVTIARPEGDLVLDSRQLRFDTKAPIFASLLALIDTANRVAPTEVTIGT